VKCLGNACRNNALRKLRKRFKSPKEAEEYYFPQKVAAPELVVPVDADVGEINTIPGLLSSVSDHNQQLALTSELFKMFCIEHSGVSPPDDFLQLSVLAMKHLESCGRSNVLYHLAKSLGTM